MTTLSEAVAVVPTGPQSLIWCLFSVENNYDQPKHNLCCWWWAKPDIQTLAARMGADMTRDAQIVAVVRVWQGEVGRTIETDYRLEQVREGAAL